ncbi:hypothetical protein JKP88DRAFT_263637 [Tribonema minus]|uniref:Uncharacterized protein n=1 Tax=Tribonema minus TaxID=303371 RepID=A0A835YU65_9STRA|nr:hypothetical protein JKP88DRAFT_263637 [Tribonema minus]
MGERRDAYGACLKPASMRCHSLQLQADLHAGTANERRCHCLCYNTTFTFGVLSRTATLKLQLHRQITPRAAAHWQTTAGRNGALPTGVQLWDVRCARWAMEPRRVQARRKRLRFRGKATDRSGRRSVLGTPWPNYGCIRLAAYCQIAVEAAPVYALCAAAHLLLRCLSVRVIGTALRACEPSILRHACHCKGAAADQATSLAVTARTFALSRLQWPACFDPQCAALHMAYSGRVMTHVAESRGGGHMEEDIGEDPEMPFGGGGV